MSSLGRGSAAVCGIGALGMVALSAAAQADSSSSLEQWDNTQQHHCEAKQRQAISNLNGNLTRYREVHKDKQSDHQTQLRVYQQILSDLQQPDLDICERKYGMDLKPRYYQEFTKFQTHLSCRLPALSYQLAASELVDSSLRLEQLIQSKQLQPLTRQRELLQQQVTRYFAAAEALRSDIACQPINQSEWDMEQTSRQWASNLSQLLDSYLP
ncbi:hypothetical protein [Aliagarivorans marinus]|uniref:hypothetical protein n=1 Tax=Aliagarivorans marinus TaxID=561965 RepID=UPI00047EC745|nr:hypothetical protein [Aliagarivorans marinus]